MARIPALLAVTMAACDALLLSPAAAHPPSRCAARAAARSSGVSCQFGGFGGRKKPKEEEEGFSLPSLPSLPFEAPKIPAPWEVFNPFGLPGTESDPFPSRQKPGGQVDKYVKGEDYLFFQSPSPKYAQQDDMPDFFSQANVDSMISDLKITPLRLAIGAVGLGAFTVIAGTLFISPGSRTPFGFLDNLVPNSPSAIERKTNVEKRASYEKALADEKAKEESKAKAKAAEAAKKAEEEKAAAATAAKK